MGQFIVVREIPSVIMAAGRDEDEESDYAPGEEERLKNVKSAAVGIPAAAALLSLRESDEASQSKDFLWDQAVKLCASGMLVLTLLEVLSSIRGEAVKCLTPDNYTRDQGGFINAFCTQFTHRTDFFLFLLVAQAILVYGPHFLWSSVYFGKFRYFSALAFSLDRHRDSKTGEFDSKNFVTVRALMDTFGSTHIIYIMYVAKLFAQLVVAVVFIGICAGLFNEYNPAFDCPSNDSLHLLNDSWPLDEQIVCVLSSLNLLFPVWWANFVLLTGTVVASLCGLVWSGVLNHQTKLNWRHVAQFALQSGIQPSYYHPKTWRKRWFSKNFCSYRIRSNLDFLFLRLYRDDAGRAQVLREVLIAQLIKEQEQRLQERLSFLRRVGDESMCEFVLHKCNQECTYWLYCFICTLCACIWLRKDYVRMCFDLSNSL